MLQFFQTTHLNYYLFNKSKNMCLLTTLIKTYERFFIKYSAI